MKRRDFVSASAIAFICGESVRAQEKDTDGRVAEPREPDHIIKGHGGCITFSPDSKVLAVAGGPINGDYGICFIDPNTGNRLKDFERTTDVKNNIDRDRPKVLAFSPDGKYFAAGGFGYVALWDATTGRRLENITAVGQDPRDTVTALAFTPDSKSLLLGFHFRSIEKPREAQRIDGLASYEAVDFSRDGTLFATRHRGIITLWEYPSLRKQKAFGREQPTGGPLIFSPNKLHIVSREVRIENRPYYFWNYRSGEPTFIDFETTPAFYFDLSPDGSLFTGVAANGIALMRVKDGRITHLLRETGFRKPIKAANENSVSAIKFSPNLNSIVLSRVSGIHVWKDANGFKV